MSLFLARNREEKPGRVGTADPLRLRVLVPPCVGGSLHAALAGVSTCWVASSLLSRVASVWEPEAGGLLRVEASLL